MKCPYCSYIDSKVLDSRQMDEGAAIRRRRLCEACDERFTTYERIDTIAFSVIKKNGEREYFDRAKLINGIMKSCHKRPISIEQIESIATLAEQQVMASLSREIESVKIGKIVMDKLRELDEVAYVRFASVYKQFKDIETFMKELSGLLKEKDNETFNQH
ncbi:MAG: transcriptional regulator NrdR [Defluviitaleaceae bacterium]|nr:transcriptional regulator NrdR [Defluviitaleaceae bacterium]